MPALSRKEKLKEESGSYVPKLVACFYAVFDPTLGPRVVHQIPEGSVATALSTFPSRTDSPSDPKSSLRSPNESATPSGHEQSSSASLIHPSIEGTAGAEPIIRSTPVLFDFSSVIDFVIPKPELCGHLITKATRTSKILGLPTRIVDEEKYHHSKSVYNRNSFIFNLCFVFERDAELSVYEPVAWKVGRILGQMEETHSLLSNPPVHFSMANLLEQMYLDLNAYSETGLTLLDTDLSLFLLPFYANPPDVKTWDVPIAVADLESMKSYSWDVTLFKICTFINGVNHVRKIAELAEVDLYLARMCIKHLVYYNAVILVDLFQFTNSYAALPDIAEIAHAPEEDEDEGTDIRLECENYVFSGGPESQPVPFSTLLQFYSQLRPGLTVSAWIDDLSLDALPIDIRRMIQFGVIKGFLRRVYAYPVWLEHPTLVPAPVHNGKLTPGTIEGENKRAILDTKILKRLDLDALDGDGGTGGLIRNRDRPSLARASSSQPKILHSPHSETSTRSAPEITNPTNNNNKVPFTVVSRPLTTTAATITTTTTAASSSHHSPVPGSATVSPFTSSPSGQDSSRALSSAARGSAAPPSTTTGTPPPIYPNSLTLMLDGNHHTDELCLKYGIGWTTLQIVLKHLGGGAGTTEGEGYQASSSRRGSRDTNNNGQSGGGGGGGAFDKRGYGKNVVMLWV